MGMFFDYSYVTEGSLLVGSGFANTFLQILSSLSQVFHWRSSRLPLSNRNTMRVICAIEIFLVATLKKGGKNQMRLTLIIYFSPDF